MSNNRNELAVYILSTVAALFLIAVAALNVLSVWELDVGLAHWPLVALTVCIDAAVPALLCSVSRLQAHRMRGFVALALLLWAGGLFLEAYGAEEGAKILTASADAPRAAAEAEAAKASALALAQANAAQRSAQEADDVAAQAKAQAEKDLAAERANLLQINDTALKTGRESKLEQLRIDRAATQKRIDELSKKVASIPAPRVRGAESFAPVVVVAAAPLRGNRFLGYERTIIIILLVAGQSLSIVAVALSSTSVHERPQSETPGVHVDVHGRPETSVDVHGRLPASTETSMDVHGRPQRRQWTEGVSLKTASVDVHAPRLPAPVDASMDAVDVSVDAVDVHGQAETSMDETPSTVPSTRQPGVSPRESAAEELPGNVILMRPQVAAEGEKLTEAAAVKMALRLHEEGKPWAKIAELTGWPKATIHKKAMAAKTKTSTHRKG
jgi:hypothetical protein